MEMKVMNPSPAKEFNFDSACTSPYISAPSSPQRFGNFFFSAPTSPTRAASFYREFNGLYGGDTAITGTGTFLSAIPFNWEEKPGIPKSNDAKKVNDDHDDSDFAFDFSGQLERTSLSADELFDGGKIKPLKPPPRLQYAESRAAVADSPKSPRSPKNIFKEAWSPREKKKDFDPFEAAIEQTRRENSALPENNQRGRERTQNSSGSNTRHKGTRSLSPFRVSDLLFDRENDRQSEKQSSSSSSSSSSSWAPCWYRKWKLKDLLLFRSASEGRASGKDPLKKYTLLKKSHQEDVKNSSFRSIDSSGSGSLSSRRGPVSAHELHYKMNRAISEEMRKKTFLPYKQGLLGCLGFNPSVSQAISKGFDSLTRKS